MGVNKLMHYDNWLSMSKADACVIYILKMKAKSNMLWKMF